MSQTLIDDLEEGEIADDIMPEPVVDKKVKPLPRRYILNDRRINAKHKRNCKHAAQHHERKNSDKNFRTNLKLHKKHRKACPNHNVVRHPKFPVIKESKPVKEKSVSVGLSDKVSRHNYPKLSMTKSAFKNFMSPPRKVSKLDNLNSVLRAPSKNSDDFPKLLSEYKKSQNELNKFKNISNLKENCKVSKEKNDSVMPKQKPSENLPSSEALKPNSDDEDEEELRRLALATCAKRPSTIQDVEGDSEKASNLQVVSDNYEVIDMEVDNDPETMAAVNDLFVIDTTPSYLCELNQHPEICSLNSNFENKFNGGLQNNGFLPNISIEGPFQNFCSDVFSDSLTNDLYSNFENVVNDSPIQSSQLDDEFEEELLRAELIANMNSMRQKNGNSQTDKENTFTEGGPVCVEAKVSKNENVFREGRTVSIKSEVSKNNNAFGDRIISIENVNSNKESVFKEERTVSIISDVAKKESIFNDRTRSVSTIYPKHDFPSAVKPSARKGVDIKVKLNNVQSSSTDIGGPSNITTFPQERIVISLNNDSSTDDSDQEDAQKILPDKNSAVASLEALIINARHESDGKKDSTNNSNNSSDAVSWLSKAQQEEYNSLVKILAKKQQPIPQAPQNKVTNAVENAGLTLLKKKLLIARKNLEKEKDIMNGMTKELIKKKRAYMVSKLKTQHLKEQLLAAERVRKSNLQQWTKCSSELQTLKKSVSKRQAIINSLQTKINSIFPEFVTNGLSPVSSHTSDHNYNLSL